MSVQESSRSPDAPPASPAPPRPIVGPLAVPPAILSAAPTAGRLLRALRRRWLLALVLGLFGGTAMGAVLWGLVPVRFTAETLLQVQPGGPRAGSADAAALPRVQKTQAQALQSPALLITVLHLPEVAAVAATRGSRDPLSWLEKAITVDAGHPGVLRVQAAGEDPEETALVLRAVVRTFLQEQADRQQTTLDHLRTAYARGAETLREKQERLASLDNPRLPAAEKDLQQARFDLKKAQVDLSSQQAQEQHLETLPAPEEAVLAYLKEDPAGRDILAERERAEAQINKILRISVLGAKDPSLGDFLKQREAAQKKLDQRRREVLPIVERQVRDRARADLAVVLRRLRDRVAALDELVKSLEADVWRMSAGGAQVRALRDEMATLQEVQRSLATEIQAAEMDKALPAVTWRGESNLLTGADARDRLEATASGAGSVGLLLMLAVAWREARRGRVAAAGDVVHGLRLPLMGNVPAVPPRVLEAKGPLRGRDLHRQGRLAEAVDALRTLLLRGAGEGPQVFMVTSAVGGEGKTTLAAQLASSLARAWRKTVLIDGDLRKPAAHRRFDVPLEPGLSEVLRGETEAGDALQPTAETRLWVMSAGHWDSHAVQALAQDGPALLFRYLKANYDCVVIDAPPVLPIADALLLSQHADGVLLVVLVGTSCLSAVHAARQRLAALDVPLLGAVVLGPDGDLDTVDVRYPAAVA